MGGGHRLDSRLLIPLPKLSTKLIVCGLDNSPRLHTGPRQQLQQTRGLAGPPTG